MISDEQIDDVPDDPDAAFVQYEGIMRETLRRKTSDRNYQGWDYEREYAAYMMAFVDIRAIPFDLPRNPPGDDEQFYEWYRTFIRAVDYYKAAARLQVSARKKQHV